jgi:proteasome lid subunit RPN8/RPN11
VTDIIEVSPETTPVSDDWATWPLRTLPPIIGTREPRFQVLVRQSALNDIIRHGKSAPDIEVCGVVLGNVYRDEFGPLLYVEAIIRGDRAKGHAAQVTFTSETWSYIHEQLERQHADKKIAGWYHTHPGHGIFLSGMDLFIQENFFNLPWQVAYVYDPQRGEDGMFIWRLGQTVRDNILVEPDEVELFSLKGIPPDKIRGDQAPPKKPGLPTWVASAIVLVVSFIVGVLFMGWLDSTGPQPQAPATQPPAAQPPAAQPPAAQVPGAPAPAAQPPAAQPPAAQVPGAPAPAAQPPAAQPPAAQPPAAQPAS